MVSETKRTQSAQRNCYLTQSLKEVPKGTSQRWMTGCVSLCEEAFAYSVFSVKRFPSLCTRCTLWWIFGVTTRWWFEKTRQNRVAVFLQNRNRLLKNGALETQKRKDSLPQDTFRRAKPMVSCFKNTGFTVQ